MKHETTTVREMLEEHLPYEFDMFFYARSKIFESHKLPWKKENIASLEVFLLHARNLIEFFNGHKNYFPIDSIFNNKTISKEYKEKISNSDKKGKISKSINIQLSHISKERKKAERHFENKNDGSSLLYIFDLIKQLSLQFTEDVKDID